MAIAWADMQFTSYIIRADGVVDWTMSSTDLPLDYKVIAPATDYAALAEEGVATSVDPEDATDQWLHRILWAMVAQPDEVAVLP